MGQFIAAPAGPPGFAAYPPALEKRTEIKTLRKHHLLFPIQKIITLDDLIIVLQMCLGCDDALPPAEGLSKSL